MRNSYRIEGDFWRKTREINCSLRWLMKLLSLQSGARSSSDSIIIIYKEWAIRSRFTEHPNRWNMTKTLLPVFPVSRKMNERVKYNFETVAIIAAIYLRNVVYDASYTCRAFCVLFFSFFSLSHNLVSLAKYNSEHRISFSVIRSLWSVTIDIIKHLSVVVIAHE